MVSPALVSSLRSQGINLSNTSIDVLKLKGCELKKLRGLGMLNLEQLANATESVLRAVPHFGVMKVKKLKTRLNAYILGLHPGLVMLSESNAEIDTGRERVIADSDDMAISSTFEFISELEEASESLEKLRKRIRLYVAEIKRQQVR
ncbi:MAG: hypothetical protein JXA46_07855 [Dehalococcoidales bacterium]|nr:hypothetical protein [Dehalococcoidales bacterium]